MGRAAQTARLRKAARRATHRNPVGTRLLSRIERAGAPFEHALSKIVADPRYDLRVRELAARLLRDVARDVAAFVPLLRELLAAGDARNPDLCAVIHVFGYVSIVLLRPSSRFSVRLSEPVLPSSAIGS